MPKPLQELKRWLCRQLEVSGTSVQPFLVLADGDAEPVEISLETGRGCVRLEVAYPGSIRETHDVKVCPEGVIWRRQCRHGAEAPLALVELGVRLCGFSCGTNRDEDYVYHTENPRIYSRFTLPVKAVHTEMTTEDSGFDEVAGTKWADPGAVSERIGRSFYQPFPAVLVSNYETKLGLVHGTLSQRRFYHNHLLQYEDEVLVWEIYSSCKSIAALTWQPGQVLEDRWFLGRCDKADRLDGAFAEYGQVLRRQLPPLHGSGAANRQTIVWGSWNDGTSRDIDEERLLKQADFLAAELPTVEWMQIDDGYATIAGKHKHAHGLGIPYEEAGLDGAKFPRGWRAFTDDVRARGIRPAVWIGGVIANESPMVAEHPDWFVEYSHRHPRSSVLDVSQPAARAFMTEALRYFFEEGGFEGMKHDFWSYAFEESMPLLANRDRTGYEWRDWWLAEIRRHLPPDGYLQTGCDLVEANPFLAEFFNNYRYGIDIGGGNWEHVRTTMQWGAACFALRIGDLFVPNSDAIGIFPGLTDREALTAINFCLITRSLVEIAGWLYQHPDHPRLKWLRKAICCPNNGQDAYFADFDYRDDKQHAPAIWYLRTPHFARQEGLPGLPLRTVALFNLEDIEQEFSITPEKLELPPGHYLATDVWSGKTADFRYAWMKRLAPHESCLVGISAATPMLQVLDADHAIDSVRYDHGTIELELPHGGELELVFNHLPAEIRWNGNDLGGRFLEHKMNCRFQAELPGGGVLTARP